MGKKLKILVLVCIVFFVADSNALRAKTPASMPYSTNDHCTCANMRTGGSIVVIDDYVVEVTTSDGSSIETFEVYSGSTRVYISNGCYESTCNYNLAKLTPGTYEAYVLTSTGEFSGPISIK